MKNQMCEIISKSGNVIEEMINMMKCTEDIIFRINPIVVHDIQEIYRFGNSF